MRGGMRVMTFSLVSTMLSLLLTHEARADYTSLLRELDEYQPPSVIAEPMSMMQQEPVSTTLLPAEQEFQDQIAALQKQQGEWIKTINEPQVVRSFLLPDSALMEALQPAANDISVAAKALSGTVTIETLEALAMLRSPAIQAKGSEFRAVLEGYSQAEDLDTILRRYAGFTKSVMTGAAGMSNPDPISFKFPFPGVLSLKGEIVSQEAQAAWEEVEAARRDIVTDVRRAHAELLYAHQALALTYTELQLLINLHKTVSARYEAGKASFSDLTSVAIEQEKVREGVNTLNEEKKNRETAIRAILLLPESIRIGTPTPPKPVLRPAKLEDLYSQAIERRQELRAKRAMIGRMERMLELAETMVYPGFSQELSLFEGDAISRVNGEGLQPEVKRQGGMAGNGGSFSVTTAGSTGTGLAKMPWFGTDDAYLRQTRQRINSLKKELEATSAATVLTVRKVWFLVDKAKRELALYRERVIPLSKANLDSSTHGYAAGQVSFAELIGATNDWLDANIALARTEADLVIAQAELDAAVGVDQTGIKNL